MKKTRQVVMLPTDNKSNLKIFKREDRISSFISVASSTSNPIKGAQHLYITSDEKIEDGDWCIGSNGVHQFRDLSEFGLGHGMKKIIATTDSFLSKLIAGGGEDNAGMWRLYPQISESFIKAYIKAYNEGNPITEVQVEYNEEYEDHPELDDNPREAWEVLKTREDNTIIIHPTKTYTRKEIKAIHVAIVKQGCLYEGGSWSDEHERLVKLEFDKWAKENLK